MACSVYGKRSCADVSSTYSKHYPVTNFTVDRTRFASEDGYRVAVNCESNVLVSFTGTLTNVDVVTEGGLSFSNFVVCVSYFNVRLPSYKHVLAKVAVSLPFRPVDIFPPVEYFVPITLTGVAPLCSGIFQFDVEVTPLLPGASACSAVCDSNEDDDIMLPAFNVNGCGALSIEIIRKSL
jgi:hypothetical protein